VYLTASTAVLFVDIVQDMVLQNLLWSLLCYTPYLPPATGLSPFSLLSATSARKSDRLDLTTGHWIRFHFDGPDDPSRGDFSSCLLFTIDNISTADNKGAGVCGLWLAIKRPSCSWPMVGVCVAVIVSFSVSLLAGEGLCGPALPSTRTCPPFTPAGASDCHKT
jgi:hypothetical protein